VRLRGAEDDAGFRARAFVDPDARFFDGPVATDPGA
jgi:hypothetical protein